MSKKEEAVAPVEEGNVDQIRDIIFGAQMRDYEKRFSRLEERVLNEATLLRSEISSRLDALESYIKQEIGSVLDQLSIERGEREDDTRHASDELSKKSSEAEKKLTQLQTSMNQGQSELRESLLKQSKSLSSDIQMVRDTLSSSLDRSVEELRDDKADRKALADMFTEVAMRLNGEFKVNNDDA